MRRTYLVAAAVIASLLASGASADLIFDQSIDLAESSGLISDFEHGGQTADDFVLQRGESTVTDIHWWGVYGSIFGPETFDMFTIRIFGDVGGAPGINPVFDSFVGDIGRLDTGVDQGGPDGNDVFAYSVNISPLPLSANTTYWLSIVNDTGIFSNALWFWPTGDFGNATERFGDGQAWDPAFGRLAFQLTDDAIVVPEPATWALFAAGLLGVGLLSRRRNA